KQEHIPQAVAMIQATFQAGRVVGPGLAGLLIQLFGEASAFFANSVSFLGVLTSLLVIAPTSSSPSERKPQGGQFREGVDYARTDLITRSLLWQQVALMGLAFPFVAVLLVYYARHVVHTDPAQMAT